MTVRYHCPITACAWFHDAAVSDFPSDTPADVLQWPATTWSLIADWSGRMLATGQVVNAHLVTHSPVEWMGEMARLQRRIAAAEQLCGELSVAVQNAAFVTAAIDPIATTRMPSRAEVESVREQLAGLVGTAVCDA